MLQRLLAHPLMRHVDLDDPSTTELRRQLLQEKPFLKKLYREWYELLAAEFTADQRVLEIGAGAGFLKDFLPGLIRSEILPITDMDLVLDAQNLPFGQGALHGIVMTDVLHHIPDCAAFLKEAARVIQPGGKLAMIEPWNNLWARFIYTHLHHEPFLPAAQSWELPTGGPLSVANGALPWMILVRDQQRFIQQHPEWQLQTLSPLMPLAYLLSGGLSLRSLLPGFSYSLLRWLEKQFFETHWGMFAHISLTRCNSD